MMKPCIAGFAAISAFSSPVLAQTEPGQSLQQQVKSLQQQVSELTTQSHKQSQWLTIGGRLQLDANIFDGAYNAENQGATGSTIFPRRARLSASGKRQELEYKMILEFADETAEILLLRFEYTGFNNGPVIKLGKIREDISLDALTSSKHMALIERSALANTFSPYFRWGVSANQYYPSTGLRYALGVYKNDAFGSQGNDQNSAVSLATTGRITYSHAPDDHSVIHLGGWGSYRNMDGSLLSASFARGEIREPQTRLVNYALPQAPVAMDSLTQFGVEAAYQYKSLVVQSEYAVRTINTSAPSDPLDGEQYQGYYLLASYMLTGESKSYSTGSARFNQPRSVANAWEVATRISTMNATSAFQGTRSQSLTLGVSYYIDKDTKIMLNGVHSKVTGPGTAALVGNINNGNALTMRFHYDF